jgi:hypothetical protein
MRGLAVLALLVLTLGAMPVSPVSADVFDPDDYYEYVVEIEPSFDPVEHADWFLTQLGVTPEHQQYLPQDDYRLLGLPD